jgi:hypothetical protein
MGRYSPRPPVAPARPDRVRGVVARQRLVVEEAALARSTRG